MAFAQVHNRVLHYKWMPSFNEGGEEVYVFINSLGTDFRIWDAVSQGLLQNGSVLLFDKAGHGLSDTPKSTDWNMEGYADDLHALLDQLGIQKVILVGLSIGGMITLQFFDKYPDRVKAMILCDTCGKIGESTAWDQRISNIEANGIESMADAILQNWFSPSYKEEHPIDLKGYRNMLVRTNKEGYLTACKAIRDIDLRHVYPKVDVPVMCICGADDRSTPPALVQEMSAELKGSTYVEISNAGHLPCIDQPAVMIATILNFI